MRTALRFLSLCLSLLCMCPGALRAQTPPAPAAAADWDVKVVLGEMADHATRLLPVLDQINTKNWVAKGASDTYVQQQASARAQARAFADGARALARDPEKFSAALELYFRLNGLNDQLRSLEEGLRKYENPALAEMLAGLAAENGLNEGRFRSYIVELAAEREAQFKVMDEEAQRCRSFLLKLPPASATKNPGRNK